MRPARAQPQKTCAFLNLAALFLMMKRFLTLFALALNAAASSFTVATYNLEFYVDTPTLGTAPKTPEAKRLIREAIRQMNPDVLALEEMGSITAFHELRKSLEGEGLVFRDAEYVRSRDTNLHLALLSKLPIIARNSHTNENFLLQGRRFHSARGFADIQVQLPNGMQIRFLSAHLKSKRQVGAADQEGLREEEALVLREIIDAQLQENPREHLILMGDLNDGISTPTLKTILGRGRARLFDTRPTEHNGDSMPSTNEHWAPRRIAWTHYFAKEELYSRIDYILTSPNLRPLYRPDASYVLAFPNWGAASDHRPVCAHFEIE
jgi:endonuclease/exonuclease/phosphatase family metal-dependent hydrolase